MSGPKGAHPLNALHDAVPAYRAAYEATKQAVLMVGQVRRDTQTIDAALAQVDDARVKLETFKAELEAP